MHNSAQGLFVCSDILFVESIKSRDEKYRHVLYNYKDSKSHGLTVEKRISVGNILNVQI